MVTQINFLRSKSGFWTLVEYLLSDWAPWSSSLLGGCRGILETLGGALSKEPCWFKGALQGLIGSIGRMSRTMYGLHKVVGLGIPSKGQPPPEP